jgi:cytidylate kinase
MGIVTISASYAAGGSEIAPRVAERLGLPFINRAIPVNVAAELGVPVESVEGAAEQSRSGFWALMASMAVVPDYIGTSSPGYVHVPSERAMQEKTEEQLNQIADGPGGVLLGRAAAIVLADRPDALHVRLDGPEEGRIKAAVRQHGISEAEARDARKTNDAARVGYVKHLYRCDPTKASLYHLVIDTVAIDWGTAEDLIVMAAAARGITPAAGRR